LYKTRRRALVIDQVSSALITVVGLSVILAVAGMMLFLVLSSWPLFSKETLQPVGMLTDVSSSNRLAAGELLFDENAPVGFVLPHASSKDCRILVRSVLTERTKETNGGAVVQQFDLVKNLTTAADPTKIPLTFQPQGATANDTSAANQNLVCSAQVDGRLLVRDGQTLHYGQVKILRTFLSGDDMRTLQPETRRSLNEKKWALEGETILVKPSQQSPGAKLSLQFESEWIIGDFFQTFTATDLQSLTFLRRPGKADGLFVIGEQNDIAKNASVYALLTQTENAITGERTTTITKIGNEQSLHTETFKAWNPVWLEGRYLLVPQTSTSLKVIDIEDAQLSAATLNLPSALGQLKTLSANYGGASVFIESEIAGKTQCASLDAGRGSRLAFGAPNLSLEIPVLWSDECSPSVRLMPHPHQRAVYRFLQARGSEQTALLEARELTTGRIAATTQIPSSAFQSAVIDGKGYLLGWNESGSKNIALLKFNAPHLEVSMQSLFKKIRYESYENASYSWQSTSGTDEFQAKFSLIPLIWGTIKATLYSLLFAVPLAIFAAVYSSEILDRQTRNVVKPTLEMMASIPSVVLGFLAAIIIAPWIEEHIVSVLLIGTSMPFMLYAAGVFLQIPSARHLTARGLYASRRLLIWVIGGFALSIWLLSRAGLWVEQTAFGGDLKSFLSGGTGTEGVLWGLLLLPLVFISLWSLPIRRARNVYRIGVFVLGPILSVWLGSLISGHTTLRGDLLGQYAQRNTLVISIAMGFAIIPIIYSLAEDALTSVPGSLRAGSLACGASVWQTTARVVLPTAASGLFSAIMVGLGRGIGETMIAVMATGNTAVMTTNPFDGLRSMAANIAVELPEAAQGSTHYRILFLSALVLFMFTFTLNSFAELLRARYRARNKAL